MKLRPFILAAFAALFAASAQAHGSDIEAHQAYAYSANPASGGVFMVIHNHGDEDDRLIGVRSDAAARVEVHQSVMQDGVMMMSQAETLVIPAGGELLLERGGYHIMFMGITTPWQQGDIVTVTLIFEHAGEITIDVPVDLTGAMGGDDEAHMDMTTMDMSATEDGASN